MQESLDIKRGNKCAYFLLYFIVQMKTLVPIYQTLFESSWSPLPQYPISKIEYAIVFKRKYNSHFQVIRHILKTGSIDLFPKYSL